MSRKRQRQPDVVIPSRGVRIPLESSAGAAANLRAYTALDETSVLTHHSGGRIWELGLPPWLQEEDLEGDKPFVIELVKAALQSRHRAGDVHNGYRGREHARTDT